jgi:hypothetical protein
MARKVRLGNWIPDDVDHRLRLFALVKRLRLTDALALALNQALPSVAELRRQLRESEAT